MKKRVVILAPHADDAEFGAGGYIQKVVEEGGTVSVFIFATGDYTQNDGKVVTKATRERETADAMGLLGATRWFHIKAFTENMGDSTAQVSIIRHVEQIVLAGPYDECLVCLPSFNQDHRALYDATITAFRPTLPARPPRLMAYEYPGNSWGPQVPSTGLVYAPMSDAVAFAKLKALQAHKSQFRNLRDGHVSPVGALTLSMLRGSECGHERAELFYLLRDVI